MYHYLDPIQAGVEYIEDNLRRTINFQDVAGHAAFSPYHFHRVFKALVGESVTDYIRLRRLSEAAKELLTARRRILDIALDYQFSSQEAFTRAFKRAYNTTPGEYRKNGSPHVLLEKGILTPQALRHRTGNVTLDPRIAGMPDFWVTGLNYCGDNKNGEIPALWTRFLARAKDVPGRVNPDLTLGVCEVLIPFTESSTFSYLAAVMVDQNSPIPREMKQIHIPAQTYAVFTHTGSPDFLDYTYRYIHGCWLLQSGYELVESHDFEWYDRRFDPGKPNSRMEIYIPVRER